MAWANWFEDGVNIGDDDRGRREEKRREEKHLACIDHLVPRQEAFGSQDDGGAATSLRWRWIASGAPSPSLYYL